MGKKRENFIASVYVYHRWQAMAVTGITPAKLVESHTCHKMLIRSHGEAAYAHLGRLAAELVRLINEYRLGRVPLVVPITLLRRQLQGCPDPYVGHQYYLEPHPEALQPRNFL